MDIKNIKALVFREFYGIIISNELKEKKILMFEIKEIHGKQELKQKI